MCQVRIHCSYNHSTILAYIPETTYVQVRQIKQANCANGAGASIQTVSAYSKFRAPNMADIISLVIKSNRV